MKILYVTTISNTVNAFLIPHIKMLINQGHQVDVAFNIEQEISSEIFEMGCKVHQLPFQRSPFKKENIKTYKMLKNVIISEEYDLVHTHTPVASAIVRLVCRKLNKVRVFYTAHGFHFFKGSSILNWLIYYPAEKFLALYTDTLITINNEDYNLAKKKLKAVSIEYIPGVGLDPKKYEKKQKLVSKRFFNLPESSIIILSVGELNKNKNHEIVIKALAKINNPNIHYLICGEGNYYWKLKKLSINLGLENNVHLLGFRNDVTDIMKNSNLFIFPSYREGLSVSLMEAMLLKVPIICSDIRGNRDLISHEKGGFLINPEDIGSLEKYIRQLIKDEDLRNNMKNYNNRKIKEYSLENVNYKLNNIYR